MRFRPLVSGVLALPAFFTLVGCSDSGPQPPRPDFTRYVAIGSSISMGWANDGVLATSQQQAWPQQLATAAGAGAQFTLPLISAPGCPPPLASPLGAFRRIDGSSIGSPSTVCAPLMDGVTLPTRDLAIEGATAANGLNETPENTTGRDRPAVVARVLPSGQTQITAMRAMKPTFVSVDFGGNEVLPAQVGLVISGVTYTPFATFQAAYTKIVDSVQATRARTLLVALPQDIRRFPTVRTGPEIAAQRAAFAAVNVTVAGDCDASPNFIFVRGAVLTAVATGAARAAAGAGPYTLSCADVPGTVDYVLTPGDVTVINTLLGQMNAEISAQAAAHSFALMSDESLYGTSKDGVPFDLRAFLTSPTPYGPKISLDGVHPSAEGQRILANAAIAAINARYGSNLGLIAN